MKKSSDKSATENSATNPDPNLGLEVWLRTIGRWDDLEQRLEIIKLVKGDVIRVDTFKNFKEDVNQIFVLDSEIQ